MQDAMNGLNSDLAGLHPADSSIPAVLEQYQIIRRSGDVVPFAPQKIAIAVTKAFLAVRGPQGAASISIRETVEALTNTVVRALLRSRPEGGTFHIEDVQDHVELALMRGGHQDVARAYVLYREARGSCGRPQARAACGGSRPAPAAGSGSPGGTDCRGLP